MEGRLPKKVGLGQFTDWSGALQERGGGVFEGVGISMHTKDKIKSKGNESFTKLSIFSG